MQILVTDATGAVGRSVTRQLIAAGHTVSGIAQHPHDALDPRVDYVCASLRNPVLQELAGEADAVIHLAPVDTSAPGGVGITGLAHVANAAAAPVPGCCSFLRPLGDPNYIGRLRRWCPPVGHPAWSSVLRHRSAANSIGWCAGQWPRCCGAKSRHGRYECYISTTWSASWFWR